MEEHTRISSGVSSEQLSGEKRKGNGLEEKDELESKRVKLEDVDSDTKTSNMQSDKENGIAQKQPNLSREHMSEMLVASLPDADAKDVKPPTVLETSTCLPKDSKVIAKDDCRCVAYSGKQALLESNTFKDDSNCESRGGHVGGGVSKNSSLLKLRETSESVGSPRGAVDPSFSIPASEKVGPLQMCGGAGSSGKSDSMRRWMEMKRNGFVSGPLGGVAAPSSAVSSTPVEIPAQKQQKNKRRGDSLKKRNEVPRKEQQQVDRFSNVTAPSGLLTELNPGIINHVRSKKQVCSIIEALIRNAPDDATMGDRHANLNVREPVREDLALTYKLLSTGVSGNANSITNPEQVTSVAVEAATVASQWLDFLHQDLSGRLSAVQDSRYRVQNILTTEFPLLISSRECSNDESTLQMTNTIASSAKAVTETHLIKWSAKFDHISKTLYDEERDLEHSLNQVNEMQSRCNEGLRQMDQYSPFSSQTSDSSSRKEGTQETSMAVQAAAASIFSTCSFLLSMMKSSPTGS